MVSRRLPNWYIIVELYTVSQSESKMNWKWSSEGHHINPEDMGVPLWTGSWCSDGGYAVPQYIHSGSVRADTALTLLPCWMLHIYIIQLIQFLPLPACLKKVQQRDLSWEKCIESAGDVVADDSLNSSTFWRRNYFFFILAHSVYKMWIIQEPNTLELWNKLHFEEVFWKLLSARMWLRTFLTFGAGIIFF